MSKYLKYVVTIAAVVVVFAAVFYLSGNGKVPETAAFMNETLTVAASSGAAADTPSAAADTPEPSEAAPAPSPTEAPAPKTATLLFAGDVITFDSQVANHKFGSSYDFTDDYRYVKDIISSADIAAVNLETVLSGKPPYTGFPRFNTPDSITDALASVGFDVVATANNHALDQGTDALKRSSEYLHSLDFSIIGSVPEENMPKYALVEKNGIKVGFVNFSNTTNRGYPEASQAFLNCMNYADDGYEQGYAAMSREVAALRDMGADFVVAFMHWGRQYELKNNKEQREEAERIADLGVDLIIGNHPHVPQNVDEYTSPVTGKNVLIYYSVGNFVSNQLYSYYPGGGYCETGVLALIKLIRGEDGSVSIDSAGFITTYTHKPDITKEYTENGETQTKDIRAFFIVPAAQAVQNPSAFEGASGSLLKHIQKGLENGAEILGESGAALKLFKFSEFTDWPW